MADIRQAAIQVLREHRVKSTVARRAVLEALLNGSGHLTADDISTSLKENYPEIHLSTVYRTLETLEGTGVVDHVHLGHGRAVYHLTSNPHQHLVCENCGGVTQISEDHFTALGDALREEFGFQLRRNHFAVLGTCRACLTSVPDTPSPTAL